MEEKVAVFGFLRFPSESMEAVRPHLQKFVDATRNTDGCITYDVAEDIFDSGLIRFSELWPNHELLDSHLKAPHIGPWREAAKRLGLQERKFTAYDLNGSRPV
jgi:quinol monooxygenase YgiN